MSFDKTYGYNNYATTLVNVGVIVGTDSSTANFYLLIYQLFGYRANFASAIGPLIIVSIILISYKVFF